MDDESTEKPDEDTPAVGPEEPLGPASLAAFGDSMRRRNEEIGALIHGGSAPLIPKISDTIARLGRDATSQVFEDFKRREEVRTAALHSAFEATNRRYDPIMKVAAQASLRATENREEVARIVIRDPQVTAIGGLRDEIGELAGIVETMADNVVTTVGVARQAQLGLDALVSEATATREETVLLRQALVDGQKTADTAAFRLLVATWVLVVLTVAIVILTVVLVTREGAG